MGILYECDNCSVIALCREAGHDKTPLRINVRMDGFCLCDRCKEKLDKKWDDHNKFAIDAFEKWLIKKGIDVYSYTETCTECGEQARITKADDGERPPTEVVCAKCLIKQRKDRRAANQKRIREKFPVYGVELK